jgi:hypothetical protein
VNGLLAGASLDQSIEQLPARHRIGVQAYLAYSRRSHMANGRFWLIPLGIIGPVLSLAAAIWGFARNLPAQQSLPVFFAAGLAVASILSTLRAGSINWALTPWQPAPQKVADDVPALTRILQRFERWQAVRATVQFCISSSQFGRSQLTVPRCFRGTKVHGLTITWDLFRSLTRSAVAPRTRRC